MLLAVATLGTGVSAEQSNEQISDLEELGILELSMDDGVIEAVVTTDAFLSFMNSDEAALSAIESISMNVGLSDVGELELTEVEIGVAEEQSDEIAVTLRLNDELVELLGEENLSSEDLLRELGFGDDLGLDDFDPEIEEDYWHSRTYWADEAYQVRGSQDDYDRVMDAEDPAEEYYNIYEEVMQEWEEEEEEHWVEEDAETDEVLEDLLRDECERGTLRGVFTIDEDGNGTMRGLVYNEDGEVMGNMWGEFDTDGFAHGLGGSDNQTDVMWKAVYMDGQFRGLWKMMNESDETRGVLKGHYEVNETEDGGVFHGKWKVNGCEHLMVEGDGPDIEPVAPRHSPLRVDADRVDVRPMDIKPKQKPLMEKIGDVMDEPLVEDENGAIVDIGDAAAGSTLGTIALLGAGFIRRRITGGL